MRLLRTIRPNTHLATVEVFFCKKVKVLATVTCPSFFGDSLFQEALLDAPSGSQAQRFILQRKVYSARDGIVNLGDPVGGEEHDPLIIL